MSRRLTFNASVAGLLTLLGMTQSASAQFPEGQPVENLPAGVEYQSNGLPIGVPETTGGIHGEPMQRYGSQHPWMHGYIQEIPPYSGYAAFRPYNYKHVLSQAQVSGGWGMSPRTPYAQQYWHRYRNRALMMRSSPYSSQPVVPVNPQPTRTQNLFGPNIAPPGPSR